MILVRKRFFRIHCEQLLANDRVRRTQTMAHPESGREVNGSRRRMKRVVKSMIGGPADARLVRGVMEREEALKMDSPVEPEVDTHGEIDRMRSGESTEAGSSTAKSSGILVGQNEIRQSNGFNREKTIQIAEHEPALLRSYHTRQSLRARTRTMTIQPNEPATYPHEPVSLPSPSRMVPPIPTSRHLPIPSSSRHSGFGGFPTPIQLVQKLIPSRTKMSLHRTLTRPAHMTVLTSTHGELQDGEDGNWSDSIRNQVAAWMPEELSGLVVGRNSRFYTEELGDDQLEQLGGVEYRALKLLSYIVVGVSLHLPRCGEQADLSQYISITQIIPFAIIAIYLAKTPEWRQPLIPADGVQAGKVDSTWYSLFLSVAAYTGAGMRSVSPPSSIQGDSK